MSHTSLADRDDPPQEFSPDDLTSWWGAPAEVLQDHKASAGGWDFAYALDGFQETRVANGDSMEDFNVNVHAHSYGTNMSAHALTLIEHQIAAVAWYGSSGIPESVADHASDFENLATDSDGKPMLFPSESNHEGTAEAGRNDYLVPGDNRVDPTEDKFGGQELYSGHEHDGDATSLADVTIHSREAGEGDPNSSGYLDEGTAHYRNVTYVLAQRHEEILTTDEYTGGSMSDTDSGSVLDFFDIGGSSEEGK